MENSNVEKNYTSQQYEYTGNLSFAQYFGKVISWMAVGLVLTALAAFGVTLFPKTFVMVHGLPAFLVLAAMQLGIAAAFSANVLNWSFSTLLFLYALEALLIGTMLSGILVVYTMESLLGVFVMTAAIFTAMGIYGRYTTTNFLSFGRWFLAGLFGLIIGSLINLIFIKSAGFDFGLNVFGALLFTLIIPFNMQQIKAMYEVGLSNDLPLENIALSGAFSLYLNFINLFIRLLQLFGKRRD